MEFAFSGQVIEWRGPAPYHYLPVPDDESDAIEEVKAEFTYGWGVIPVTCRIGATSWTTSLFPREGRFLVPLKDAVRTAEGIHLGDEVHIEMRLGKHA